MPSEAFIKREGELYGLDPDAYFRQSPILRSSSKSVWMKERRKEAADRNLDVEAHLQEAQNAIQRRLKEEFPDEMQGAPQQATSNQFGPDPGSPPRATGSPLPRDLFAGGVLPRRQSGNLVDDPNRVPDLVGDGNPRTLSDIYARWPVGKNTDYYIRVERVQPKSFQNVPCAGHIGDIHIEMTEQEFSQYFGGRDYLLTVYGPDPRKKDESGQPVIKALCYPVKVAVAIFPPNLHATSLHQKDTTMQPGYPQGYPMPFGMGAPPNVAEAQMHGKTLDVLGNMVKEANAEKERLRVQAGQSNGEVLRFVSEANKSQVELLREQMQHEREDAKRLRDAAQVATGSNSNSTIDLVRALAPNKDADLGRMQQMHSEQLTNLRASHDSAIAALRTSHEGTLSAMRERYEAEVKRAEGRLAEATVFFNRDIEQSRTSGQQTNESLRRDFEQRENRQREELAVVRRELREDSDKRLAELKDRYQEQLRDIDRNHEREIRTIKEANDTKLHVTDATAKMEITQLRERLAEQMMEVQRLRGEVESLSDPVQQVQKAEAQAAALGYTKEDPSAPKSAWEHFASTVGSGLGQAIGSVGDWGPTLLQQVQQAQALRAQQGLPPGPPQLPPGAQGAPQLSPGAPGGPPAPPAQPRRRQAAMHWATENSSNARSAASQPSLGFVAADALAQPASPVEAVPSPAPQAPPDGAVMTQQQMEEAIERELPPVPSEMSQFTKVQIYGFINALESNIKSGTNPTVFVDMFSAQYPEDAEKASSVPASVIVDYVKAMAGTEDTEILSRGGKQWLSKLEGAFRRKYPPA